MKVMIVESPTKVKKIQSILGPGWKVMASSGHIRDLPKKEMGFCPPDFKPQYVMSSSGKRSVDYLKKNVNGNTEVYLAMDPDREGEAIAWHLKEVLDLSSPARVSFNAITKDAILLAVSEADSIDDDLVAAQEARRVLDRIVGFEVSPVLSKKAGVALSAGRVQSPAVKLVVLREEQIENHVKKKYFKVVVELSNGVKADLDLKGWSEDEKYLYDEGAVEAFGSVRSVVVGQVVVVDKAVNPRPSFTTASLQQVSSKILGLSPGDTMKSAQALFEKGLITYHRTDCPNLSSEGFGLLKGYLDGEGLETQSKQIVFRSKKGSQEAHEAIRPTDPGECYEGESAEHKLYELIRERALGSVLSPGLDKVTKVELKSNDEVVLGDKSDKPIFRASGVVREKRGWRDFPSIEKASAGEGVVLPAMEEGQEMECSPSVSEKYTEPPSRFTEATLISAMEKLGIGRPSTYASIMQNIGSRSYISIGKKKEIKPTDVGRAIIKALRDQSFLNLDYTKTIEDYLDKIASGEASYHSLVSSVHQDITSQIGSIGIGSLLKTSPCPSCSKDLKRLKSKKNGGHFWVHVDDGHECSDFIADARGKPVVKEKYEILKSECPQCDKGLKRLKSKSGDSFFWVHEGKVAEGECYQYFRDREGKPVL